MKIYADNGYINIRGIVKEGYPFNFIVGGRGTGKTYTALKTAYEDRQLFMLMRRTQSQADLISKPEFSVFKPLNRDMEIDVRVERISKYNSAFYVEEPMRRDIGYTCALSTISSMRGFDASDISLLIYDEFIPESHERPIKHEGDALFNAYETMNRNRELSGDAPIQMLCLANANYIDNPVFESLHLIRIADKLQRGNQERWTDDKRGIQLIMLQHSPISAQKTGTVLYNLTAGSDFAKMALRNSFNESGQHVQPQPLQEYRPVCCIGELYIYKHKNRDILYATTHCTGVFHNVYTVSDSDRAYYRRKHATHWYLYMSGKILFEDLLAEKLFLHYWA